MFKDIFLPVTETPGDADALAVAIELATRFDAHLTVLKMLNLPIPSVDPWGVMPELAVADIYAELRVQCEDDVARLKMRLARESIGSDVRMLEALFDESPRIAACQAHYADLVVVAGSRADLARAAMTREYFSSLLLESGRPVLVVPPGCTASMAPGPIVVAWRPGREATRALHDALPLLREATRVDIVVVVSDNDSVGGESANESGADIVAHLGRHGVKSQAVVLGTDGQSVGSVLLDHSRETGVHLLVAGGYGHSRLREWALGGVTRKLLASASLPVFFSH